MMCKVLFSGKEDGKTYTFEMNREINSISVIINVGDKNIERHEQMDVREMCTMLSKYCLYDDRYENKKLTTTILTKKHPDIIYKLFRSFAATDVDLHYFIDGYISEKLDIPANKTIEHFEEYCNKTIECFKEYCYDSTCLELSGTIVVPLENGPKSKSFVGHPAPAGRALPNSLCGQNVKIKKSLFKWNDYNKRPVMYFLKNMDEKDNNNIMDLYDAGLLHKIEVRVENDKVSRELSNYYVPFDVQTYHKLTPATEATWNRIIQDMKERLSKYK